MDLSESQKATVSEWVSEGLKLSDIQSRINVEFGLSLTYMDARFLIDDLELDLVDQPKSVDNDLRNAPPLPEPALEGHEEEKGDVPSTDDGGGVSISLDKLYKPGAVASGEVVFSDGQKAEWSLDQAGRLSLNAGVEGYQPNEGDIQDFQKKLSLLLQKQGF